MTESEKRSTRLLHSTDELRQLIIDNPTLPMLVFADENAYAYDGFNWCSCTEVNAKVGEYLDCWQEIERDRCFTKREDFRESLEEHYLDYTIDVQDKEYQDFINEKFNEYLPYWKKAILVYVSN